MCEYWTFTFHKHASIHSGSKNRRGCNLGIVSGTDVQVNFVVGGDCGTDDDGPLPCQLEPEEPDHLDTLLEHPKDGVNPEHGGWRACILEALRTCGGCLMVVCCACAVHFGHGALPRYVDPVLAVLAVVILICTSYPRMKESGLILLQNIPTNMDIATMQKKLLEQFPAILNVHEFHLWQLTNTRVIATLHIVVPSQAVYTTIADKLKRFLRDQGISSMTLQPEFCQATHITSQCILQCSGGKLCGSLTCCGRHTDGNDQSELRNRKGVHHDCGGGGYGQFLTVPMASVTRCSSVISLDSVVLSELGVLKETDL